MNNETRQILENSPLFSGLRTVFIDRVAAATSHRKLGAGEMLFQRGDPADALWGVLSGRVSATVSTEDGKEMILGLLGQYDIFGELLLLPSERRPNQAEAVVDTTLIVMPEQDFQRLLSQQPQIAMKFIKVMSTRLWQAQQWQAQQLRFVEEHGYVKTLMGRLRYIAAKANTSGEPLLWDEISRRKHLERAAINTPVLRLFRTGFLSAQQ